MRLPTPEPHPNAAFGACRKRHLRWSGAAVAPPGSPGGGGSRTRHAGDRSEPPRAGESAATLL
eukprot:15458021-Alexandrium_andersonii.AAC.1